MEKSPSPRPDQDTSTTAGPNAVITLKPTTDKDGNEVFVAAGDKGTESNETEAKPNPEAADKEATGLPLSRDEMEDLRKRFKDKLNQEIIALNVKYKSTDTVGFVTAAALRRHELVDELLDENFDDDADKYTEDEIRLIQEAKRFAQTMLSLSEKDFQAAMNREYESEPTRKGRRTGYQQGDSKGKRKARVPGSPSRPTRPPKPAASGVPPQQPTATSSNPDPASPAPHPTDTRPDPTKDELDNIRDKAYTDKDIFDKWDDAHKDEKDWSERATNTERLKGELEGLQKAERDAFAERMRLSAFTRKSKKAVADDKYRGAEKAYLEKLSEYEQSLVTHDTVRAEYKSFKEDDTDVVREGKASSIKSDVYKEFGDRINTRFAEDETGRIDAMVEQGGLKARMLDKFAGLSKKQKIIVSIGAAGLFAAGGWTVAALTAGVAGGVAAGASVAAGAGVAGGRFGRSYATRLSRLYTRRDTSELPKYEASSGVDSSELVEKAIDWLQDRTDEEIESGDKIKRNAVFAGMGAVAVGALAADLLTGADEAAASSGEQASALNPAEASVPPVPDETVTDVPEVADFGTEAATIDSGEGFYQTFKEMGIPREDWPQLLEEAGPQLENMEYSDGTPVSYYDSVANEWRMNMSPDGTMPADALQTIQDAHEGMGSTGMDVPGASDTDASNGSELDASVDGSEAAQGSGSSDNADGKVNGNTILGGDPANVLQQGADAATGNDIAEDVTGTTSDTIEAQISEGSLEHFPVTPSTNVDAAEFMRDNGLKDTWENINNLTVGTELQRIDPKTFWFEDANIHMKPNANISDEAWKVIISHMSNAEKAKFGLPV